jgi:hypothetical protein
MPELFLLSRAQMRRIKPFFPKPRGLPRSEHDDCIQPYNVRLK